MSRIVSKPQPVAYLSLQICLVFDWYFQAFFSFTIGILLLYKLYLHAYPVLIACAEVGLLIVLQMLQFLRNFVGSKGNKTEDASITVLFILLTLVTTALAFYFAVFQTYVIILEAVLVSGVILLGLIEILIGLVAFCEFCRID